MFKNKSTHVFLCLVACHVNAIDYDLNFRFGGQRSFLTVENLSPQQPPTITTTATPIYIYSDTTNVNLNALFYGTSPESNRTAANSKDTSAYNQLTIGLKGYIIPQVSLPSETQVYGITGSINGLYEGDETSVQSHLYGYLPLSTVFADIGLLTAHNGSKLEIGAGIQALRFDISTDEVYGALSSIRSADSSINLDTTVFAQADDKEPYTAKVDYSLHPYLYTEISTPVGDILNIFAKATYAPKITPDFSVEDDISNTQMFPGGLNNYQNNIEWEVSSFAIGIQARVN